MKGRLLALVLCAVLLLSAAPVAAAETAELFALPFKDVSVTSPYYYAISFVYDNGFLKGVSDDRFEPGGLMTRAMFVAVLGRYAGFDISGYGASSFDDVPETEYYSDSVEWAAKNDIVTGIGDNKFNPDGFITREQMFTVLMRFADATGKMFYSDYYDYSDYYWPAVFADVEDISSWALPAIERMQYAGVLNAQDDAFLLPLEYVTRGEIAETLLYFDGSLIDDYRTMLVRDFIWYLMGEGEGSLEAAYAMMGDTVRAHVDGMGGIEAFAASILDITGEILYVDEILFATEIGGYLAYTADVSAENGGYSFQVTFDAEDKVAGVVVSQDTSGAEPRIEMPGGYLESAVVVDAGMGYPLEGLVVRPENAETKVPAVLLVAGSGPADYDEIMGVNRIFGKFARGLAERGVATMRFNKRTYQYPNIAAEVEDFSVRHEYIEDVLAAVELLKAQPGVDPERVYIVGHSQGGMLAPRLAASGIDVAGMVLLAGSPRNLMDIGYDQQMDTLGYYRDLGLDEIADMYEEIIAGFEAERAALEAMTEDEARDYEGMVYGLPAYYMYDLVNFDAIATIKKLAIPTLILQGSKDYQVYADVDFEIYKKELAGEDYVSFKLYEGLSHGFMPTQATNLIESVLEYSQQMEVPGEVFDDIADWIRGN